MNVNLKEWSETNPERDRQISFRANGDENGIEIYFRNNDFDNFSLVVNASGPTDVKIFDNERVLYCFGVPFSCLENIVDSVRAIKSKHPEVKIKTSALIPIDVSDSINDLVISVRTYKALKEHGIISISQLENVLSRDLLRIPNFGRKALNELKDALKVRGITLK